MCPALVSKKRPILLLDNAKSHIAFLPIAKSKELGIDTLSNTAYSPGLSKTEFHLVRYLSHVLREKQFANRDSGWNAFKKFIESRRLEFYAIDINKLIFR